MGIEGFGTQLRYNTGGGWLAVAQVIGVTGPDAEVDDIEVSNNDCVDRWVTYLPGMIKAGTVGLKLHYGAEQTEALRALVGVKGLTFQVLFSDGSSWGFTGYLKSLGQEAPHDDAVTQEATFKLDGKPTFAVQGGGELMHGVVGHSTVEGQVPYWETGQPKPDTNLVSVATPPGWPQGAAFKAIAVQFNGNDITNDAQFRAVYDDETYGSWIDFTGPNITGQEDWLSVADQTLRQIVAVELDVKTEGAGGWNVYVRFIGLG